MKFSSALLAGISLAVVCNPVLAQDADTAQEAAPGGEADDGIILVTAQKRAEDVQDVPKTVTVVGGDELREAGISSIRELDRVSVAIQGSPSGPFGPPAIRGVSTFGFSIGVQTQTGIVLDDIPQPSFSTLANELSDIERVEVLPGPQSTLSGRNAAGGLINIVTHNPTDTFEGRFSAEQTDDRQSRLSGYVSGPLSANLGFSLSGYYNTFDGLLRNAQENDRRLGGFESAGVRGKLMLQATEDVSFLLTGYYTHSESETQALLFGAPYIFANAAAGFAFAPGVPLADLVPGQRIGPYNRYTSSIGNSVSENENSGVSLRIDVDTGIGAISSISNYSHGSQPRTDLFMAFPLFGQTVNAITDTKVDYYSQELRLASTDSSSPFQYLLGAIYTDTENFQPYARNVLFPVDWDRTARVKSFATFGRATYEIVEGTRITGGLRFQSDRQSYNWVFLDLTAPTSSGSSSGSFVTGEASIQHEFSDSVMGYFTYANAQSGPAYDLEDAGAARTPAGLVPIDSQKVQSFELGLKTQNFDRSVTVNLSAFSATYDNYQVQSLQVTCVTCTPAIQLFAVGNVRNQGIELQSSFRPVDGLRINFDATYLDAKIRDYPGAQCFPGQTEAQGCVGGVQNRRGRLPNTSKLRLQSDVEYTLPLESASFDPSIRLGYRYRGAVGYDLFGDPLAVQEGVGVFNLAIGADSHSGFWNAELFVNNLFDRNYYATVARDLVFLQPPGGVAVTASYARDSFRYFGARINFEF